MSGDHKQTDLRPALEKILPLMSLSGRLWLPAGGDRVLRLKTKAPTIIAIDLRSAISKKREATWYWLLSDATIKHGSYYADHDLVLLRRSRSIDKATMFAISRERHRSIIERALMDAAGREHVFAGLNNCGICGRELSDPDSRARGTGPECLQKYGLTPSVGTTSAIFAAVCREGTRP